MVKKSELEEEIARTDYLADKLREAVSLLSVLVGEIEFFAHEAHLKSDRVVMRQVEDFIKEFGKKE